MRKFEVVNLADLPLRARFYFSGDRRKKVYEIHSPKPDASLSVFICAVGSDDVKRVKTYHASPMNHPPIKCIFLSSLRERVNK